MKRPPSHVRAAIENADTSPESPPPSTDPSPRPTGDQATSSSADATVGAARAAAEQLGEELDAGEHPVEREPEPPIAVSWEDTLRAVCLTLPLFIPNRYREFREPFKREDERLVHIWAPYLDKRFPIQADKALIVAVLGTVGVFAAPAKSWNERFREAQRKVREQHGQPQAFEQDEGAAAWAAREARARGAGLSDLRSDEIRQEPSGEGAPSESSGVAPGLGVGPEPGVSRGGF